MMPPMPDFGLLGTETVTVLRPTVSYGEHMREQTEWGEETVAGCLVRPGATSNLSDPERVHGDAAALTVHVPKSYTSPLRGCRVRVRGVEYEVGGDPDAYMEENTPGPWNRSVPLEVVHG